MSFSFVKVASSVATQKTVASDPPAPVDGGAYALSKCDAEKSLEAKCAVAEAPVAEQKMCVY